MPKPSRKKPKPRTASLRKRATRKLPERDENQMAFDVIRQVEALGALPAGKDPLAVLFGRRGGLKGGRARADKMSKDQRRESATKAARARWDRKTV